MLARIPFGLTTGPIEGAVCLSREMGANLHLKETPVDLLHKKVRVENGGHLTREKRTTWRIAEPL
jgi:hypothetical protein